MAYANRYPMSWKELRDRRRERHNSDRKLALDMFANWQKLAKFFDPAYRLRPIPKEELDGLR